MTRKGRKVVNETLVAEIQTLKKDRQAVILAHNYEPAEIQDIADFTGDSLGLSRQAAGTPAKVIVFCGVRFMAETASILCPDKTVLLPAADAGCPLADRITAAQVRELKKAHPGAEVVAYVNTSAEVKAESTIVCTSANSVAVVKSLPPDKEIIFIPDHNLGLYTQVQSGRTLIVWDGACPIHKDITAGDVRKARAAHPAAKVMVHPECLPEVVALCDAALSTAGMAKYVEKTGAREFIVGTETAMLYPLQRDYPDRKFYPLAEKAVCADMKKITLAMVRDSLRDLKPEIRVSEEIRKKALLPVKRMLSLAV
jgi:quinolinate synthase